MKSKFKYWTILVIVLFLFVTWVIPFIVLRIQEKGDFPTSAILVFFILGFMWIWLFLGELRTKAIQVKIEDEQITVKSFLGFGIKRSYPLSEFDGMETALLPSKYDTYEYLYLVKNGKKLIKLSEFYHRNYPDLKEALLNKVPYMGEKDFTLLQELKEIFL